MRVNIIGHCVSAYLLMTLGISAQTTQEARLHAYQDYWQPIAKDRFNQIADHKMEALRSRALANGISFPDTLEVKTTKGRGSPISYLHRNLMVIPEEYLFQVISKSETLAILELVLLDGLFDSDPEYGLLMCYFEILVQYDNVQGTPNFQHCTRDQRQKLADIRTEALKTNRSDYYDNLYFFYDAAIEMMLAHEASHFALRHIAPKNEEVAHAQEYAADEHAKSMLDLVDVAGASVPLLILALGQPNLLTANTEATTAPTKLGFSTHPSPQCRALYLTQKSGGVAQVFSDLVAESDELDAFKPFIEMAAASLPELSQAIDQLACDTPD